jgi:hypothetical protein
MTYYSNWEQAARSSRMERAVTKPFNEIIYSKTRRQREVYAVEIVKPLHGDPYMIYSGSGIKVDGRKVTAAECDRQKIWKPV